MTQAVRAAPGRERPILFSREMVLPLLSGRKSETRRLVEPQPPSVEAVRAKAGSDYGWFTDDRSPGIFRVSGPVWAVREMGFPVELPARFVPGDHLWVREQLVEEHDGWHYGADSAPIELRADDPRAAAMIAWAHHEERGRCPAIHMPRWASRITLEVTAVRIERLQDLTEDDARAEGVDNGAGRGPRMAPSVYAPRGPMGYRRRFIEIWERINGKRGSWDSNPWVFVVTFRRVK
jgi:hypothetical protein